MSSLPFVHNSLKKKMRAFVVAKGGKLNPPPPPRPPAPAALPVLPAARHRPHPPSAPPHSQTASIDADNGDLDQQGAADDIDEDDEDRGTKSKKSRIPWDRKKGADKNGLKKELVDTLNTLDYHLSKNAQKLEKEAAQILADSSSSFYAYGGISPTAIHRKVRKITSEVFELYKLSSPRDITQDLMDSLDENSFHYTVLSMALEAQEQADVEVATKASATNEQNRLNTVGTALLSGEYVSSTESSENEPSEESDSVHDDDDETPRGAKKKRGKKTKGKQSKKKKTKHHGDGTDKQLNQFLELSTKLIEDQRADKERTRQQQLGGQPQQQHRQQPILQSSSSDSFSVVTVQQQHQQENRRPTLHELVFRTLANRTPPVTCVAEFATQAQLSDQAQEALRQRGYDDNSDVRLLLIGFDLTVQPFAMRDPVQHLLGLSNADSMKFILFVTDVMATAAAAERMD